MSANQRSTKATSQKSDGELIARALRDVFISPNELDSNWEPAGVVDALFSVSRSLSEIAQAITSQGWTAMAKKPKIVCLCGSTRFYQAFQRANYEETMAGKIVLSVGFYPHAQHEMHGEQVGVTPEQKAALDELHLRKIDLADEVLFLNVGGYLGESSRRELAYARSQSKVVRFLEPA